MSGTSSRNALQWFSAGLAVLLLIGALALPTLQSARAQQPTPSDDDVNRIAHTLYCPVCENTPLDVCPTEACRQWRDLIRQQLSEGWSETRIQQYFVDQYGARVLAEPPRTGLNWLVYVLPPAIILAGVIMLFRSLRSWKGRSASSAPGASSPAPSSDGASQEYVNQLEDELKKRS